MMMSSLSAGSTAARSAPGGGKAVSDGNGIATAKNSSPFARCIVVIRTPGTDLSSAPDWSITASMPAARSAA